MPIPLLTPTEAKTACIIEWDEDGDGGFATDISGYVMDIKTTRGRRDDLGRMPPGTAVLILNNHDGRFSPDKTDGPYYGNLEMYRRVRIKEQVEGAKTYGVFYGFILDFDNKPKMNQQTVTWYLGDRFALWQYSTLNLPLLRKMPAKLALDMAVNRAVGDNECDNSSVETNITDYSALQGVTPVRDPTMKMEGDYSVFCDCPGTNAGEGWRFDATGDVTHTRPIIARVWARASETVNLVFRAYDSVLGERYKDTVSVGTTPTLLSFIAVLWFGDGNSHYFELYTEVPSEVMFWSDGLWFDTPANTGEMLGRDLDSGTAEIELAASYRQPALEVIQAIAESEPRSFFFMYCGKYEYDERLRFYDKDHRSAASSETFSDDGSDVPYQDLVHAEHAIDRISECELTSQGDFEDANTSAPIWELSPTGYLIPATESLTIHALYPQPARDCSLEVPVPPTAFVIAQESDDAILLKFNEDAPVAYDATILQVGLHETGNTYRFRSFLRFDTSAIPDGATITAAQLVLTLRSNHSDLEFDINVRDAPSWHPISSDDWTKGNGEDLLGSINTADLPPADEEVRINIDDLTGIDKTGWTEFRLASGRDEDAEDPTLNVLELVIFHYYGAGEAVRPRLEATYTGAAFASATMENYGLGAKIVLTADAEDAIVPDVSITGYPLRGTLEESKVVDASASPPAIERTLKYALPLQGTRTASMVTEAERLADRYDGRIKRCSMVLRPRNNVVLTQMLIREIGDKIHVENTSQNFSTWIDGDFWIEGIEHHIQPGIFHETIFQLEEA